MSESLAVKYRPKTLEISVDGAGNGIIGQDLTVKILKRQIETGAFKHAYLFVGKTGSGKTTLARAFAKELNDGIGQPIEIDSASNGSVDSIRAIVQSAQERAVEGKYKIFIMDEAHAISVQGWQAFLKCIEEPPAYTVFIFCTTEVQKVPATILNRVQRFNIQPVPAAMIYKRLDYICQQEGFTDYQETIDLISKLSAGSVRDAITRLESCADLGNTLNIEVSRQRMNVGSYESAFKLLWALRDGDQGKMLSEVDSIANSGKDLRQFALFLTGIVLDLQKFIIFNDISVTGLPAYLASDSNPVVQYTVGFNGSLSFFNDLCDTLLNIRLNCRYDSQPKDLLDLYFLQFMRKRQPVAKADNL